MAERDPAQRTRRRFARRQWARRWLAWKYVVVIVLLVALVVGGVWLVYFSSVLAVKGVEVDGISRLREAQVRAVAAVPDGEPLARVDLDRIRSRVEAMAGVRSADVTRQWPDQIRIDVEERVAVAVAQVAGQLRGMDADGVLFEDYATAPAGLPRVEVGADTGSDALREAALVIAALPADLQGKVDHVEVSSIDEISLDLRDGRTVAWGSAAEPAEKAEVLAGLLVAVPRARHYDVTVPGHPTTRN
jgi:cell division protein FtsQ